MKFESGNVQVRKSGRLPHWDVQHGICFVTFNLFDAVPAEMLLRVQQEASAQVAHIQHLRGQLTIAEKRAIDLWLQAQIGEMLDGSLGKCFMRDQRIAKIVADAIVCFDEQRCRLFAWCVMPNHVHVLFNLIGNTKLDELLHSWKSYTSKAANRVLGRTGEFWQKGYYDRTIRDSRELACTVDYILSNPVRAGLEDWQFVNVYSDRLAALLQPGGTPGWSERDARPPRP